MFTQVNSEHCRHKIFNTDCVIDGQPQTQSLFKVIKSTYEQMPEFVLSVYKDNATAMERSAVGRFFPDARAGRYDQHQECSAHFDEDRNP